VSHLSICRIEEICDLIKGTYPTLKTKPGEYPLVVTAQFRRSASTYQIDGKAVCIPLISSTGHGDAALHRVHYEQGKFAVANLLVALVVKDENICLPKYLYYLLNTKRDDYFVPLMRGTANVSLKINDIAEVEVPLPPLSEQRRIVAKIEQLAAKIEEAQKLAMHSFRHSFILLGSIVDNCTMACPSEILSLKDVLVLHKPGKWGDDPVPGQDMPVVRSTEFFNGHISPETAARRSLWLGPEHSLRDGDLLVIKSSGSAKLVGEVTIFEQPPDGISYYHSNFVHLLRPNLDRVIPHFLWYVLRSPRQKFTIIEMNQTTSGLRNLRMGDYLSLKIPVPPLDKQRHIVAYLNDLQAKVDSLKQLQEQTTAELDALLPSILDKAFKGELIPMKAAEQVRATTPYKDDAAVICLLLAEMEKLQRPTTEFFIQKHIFVIKHHLHLPLNSLFVRKAAGPWSHELKQKAIFAATKMNWLRWEKSRLVAGPAFEKALSHAATVLGEGTAQIAQLVNDLKKFHTNGLERWTTVLKVVEDLKEMQQPITRANIQHEINSWPGKSLKEIFAEESVDHTIKMMLKHNWLPTSAGQ